MVKLAGQSVCFGDFPVHWMLDSRLRAGTGKGNPTVLFAQSLAMVSTDVDAIRFLPSVLNGDVMKVKQARVDSESNHDFLKAAKCLVI